MLQLLASDDHTSVMLQTMATAIAAGALLITVARKLNLPGIVLLLAGGFLLGPAIGGEHALVQPESLGDGLRVIVSMAVGLILFEGGLTLDVSGYRTAPRMIKRLLSVGVLITWLACALTVKLFFDLPWEQALLAGSLVIVTGPTVIAPLLKRIKVEDRLNSILHWEGVLIDPVGVFVAILCFEAIAGGGGQAAAVNLLIRVAVGLPLGVVGGLLLQQLVRRRMIDEEHINILAFGAAVFIFALAEAILPEMGLLAVTAAGFVFGLSGTASMKKVREFKAVITDLLIGTLFILLAARLDPKQFVEGFGLRGVLAVVVVMIAVRPLSVFLCAWGDDLTLRQKLFLSWVAPRGIVAASLASLVAIRLGTMENIAEPRFVETFTYSVIIATIVIQGMSAGPLARLLKIARHVPTGWMIIGAHALGRGIAGFLARDLGRHVVLIDTNDRRVRIASGEGLVAISRDARDTSMAELPLFQNVGNVLALTDNEDLNARICRNWGELLGRDHVFRYAPDVSDQGDDPAHHDLPTGRGVWAGMAPPGLLAGEIEREETRLVVVAEGAPPPLAEAMPLVVSDGETLTLEPGEDIEDRLKPEEARGLFLVRRTDYLRRCLRAELFVTIKSDTLEGLFEELLAPVVPLLPRLPRDEVIRELVDRERAFPTALGHGIATPHTYHESLDTRLCVVGRVPSGIEYGARDGEPVKLIFLLLSPPGDPDGHLATLAELSRIMVNPASRARALAAISGAEIIDLVRDV